MIDTFKQSPYVQDEDTLSLSKADVAFARSLQEIIEANMGNPEFNRQDLASMLNMSQSSLYRKIKGVYGMSPNDFIRVSRLKKASELFRKGETQVSEVCYLVGFNSPSYFTKCYLSQFGIHPSEFIEKLNG